MNDTKTLDSSFDANVVGRRLAAIPPHRFQGVLLKCALINTIIITLWLFAGVSPGIRNGTLTADASLYLTVAIVQVLISGITFLLIVYWPRR